MRMYLVGLITLDGGVSTPHDNVAILELLALSHFFFLLMDSQLYITVLYNVELRRKSRQKKLLRWGPALYPIWTFFYRFFYRGVRVFFSSLLPLESFPPISTFLLSGEIFYFCLFQYPQFQHHGFQR